MLKPEYSLFRLIWDTLILGAVLIFTVVTFDWQTATYVAVGWGFLDNLARYAREAVARDELKRMANDKGLKLGWVKSNPTWSDR